MFDVNALKDDLKRQLNQRQYNIATTRTETGYRRVRGPAGSGKSLALAARAALLACKGKSILVCNYNIALLNYLSDLVDQFIPQEVSRKITFSHFHSWCKDVCEMTGYKDDYYKLWDYPPEERLNYRMAKLVYDIYESQDTPNLPRYDAILLDEGHDFQVFWWQTLRKAVRPGGEALFVCDKTQDLYSTAEAWTDETMEGLECGFTGRWGELSESYRLPTIIIPILKDFLTQFHYQGEINIPPPKAAEQTDLLDRFRWVQVPPWKLPVDACIEEVERLHEIPNIPSVCFLSEQNVGEPLVKEFRQRGKDIFSTHYEDWRTARRAKLNLRPGRAEIIATTVHSFKGWETPHLVVHVDRMDRNSDRTRFYTALSRLKRHPKGCALTVVSSCPEPELEQFGRKHFPDFDPPSLGGYDFNGTVDAIPF